MRAVSHYLHVLAKQKFNTCIMFFYMDIPHFIPFPTVGNLGCNQFSFLKVQLWQHQDNELNTCQNPLSYNKHAEVKDKILCLKKLRLCVCVCVCVWLKINNVQWAQKKEADKKPQCSARKPMKSKAFRRINWHVMGDRERIKNHQTHEEVQVHKKGTRNLTNITSTIPAK